MANDPSLIPIRSNNSDIDASWWNTIRTFLINAFGVVIGPGNQSLGNGVSDVVITNLENIDGDVYFRADVSYTLRRKTATLDYVQSGQFQLHWKAGGWEKHGDDENINGDDALTTFNLLQAGELITVRATTQSMSGGSYEGNIDTKVDLWSK